MSASTSSRRSSLALLAGALLACSALAGCMEQSTDGDHGGGSPGRPAAPAAAPSAAPACACDDETVVDPTLLAFLSLARAAHHEADLALETADGSAPDAAARSKAVAALERVAKAPWSGKKPPEVAEVMADTLARLADLRSESGDFDAASRDVDAGIALAAEPTHFRGRLFEVRGLVEERRAKALKEKGDAAGAERAKKAALDAFGQAMDIQEDVIGRALKEKEKRDGR